MPREGNDEDECSNDDVEDEVCMTVVRGSHGLEMYMEMVSAGQWTSSRLTIMVVMCGNRSAMVICRG
jgi:hypothetical protein